MNETQVVIGLAMALIIGIWLMVYLLDGNKLTNKLLKALQQNLDVELVQRKYFWQSNYLTGELRGFPVKIFEYSRSQESMPIAIRITLPKQIFNFSINKKAKLNFTKPDVLTGISQIDQHYLFKTTDIAETQRFLDNQEVLQALNRYTINFKASDAIEVHRQYLYYFFPSTNITKKRKARFMQAVNFSLLFAHQLTQYSDNTGKSSSNP